MARRTIKDVRFYVDLLNDKLQELNIDAMYNVTRFNGTLTLNQHKADGTGLRWQRCGLSTKEMYEVVYNMYEMLARNF